MISGDDVESGKPNLESYLKAVESLPCEKENIIVIENAPFGIQSAVGAGLRTVALTTTLDEKYLKDANKVFFLHKELVEYLKSEVEKN